MLKAYGTTKEQQTLIN